MKMNKKWKKAGVLFLTASVLGSTRVFPDTGLISSLAARDKSPVTEYDEATLALFEDNILEYWEIPGLIERYNPVFVNRLDSFYSNPDGTSGLTREQLEYMAYELRAEAAELSAELEDGKDEFSAGVKKEYEDNISSLKKFASKLERSAEGEGSAGVLRTMRREKNKLIAETCAKMRDYQVLEIRDELGKKKLELAGMQYQAAVKQQELGTYSREQVLAAEESLNSARAAANALTAALTEGKQSLIMDLGWAYNGNPEILAVPDPDVSKIDGYDPAADIDTALGNNYDLADLKLTDSKSLGGSVEKARQVKDQEDQVRMKLDDLYKKVLQAETSYSAAMNGWTAAEADKARADRKSELGMLSGQDYLAAETAWLNAKASKEQAAMDLISAMETYEWAVEGMMPETQK